MISSNISQNCRFTSRGESIETHWCWESDESFSKIHPFVYLETALQLLNNDLKDIELKIQSLEIQMISNATQPRKNNNQKIV